MRQISVFSSNGVGAPISVEHEPDKQIKRTIQAANALLKSNGLWPPESRHLENQTSWVFDLQKAVALQAEIDKLQKLL